MQEIGTTECLFLWVCVLHIRVQSSFLSTMPVFSRAIKLNRTFLCVFSNVKQIFFFGLLCLPWNFKNLLSIFLPLLKDDFNCIQQKLFMLHFFCQSPNVSNVQFLRNISTTTVPKFNSSGQIKDIQNINNICYWNISRMFVSEEPIALEVGALY